MIYYKTGIPFPSVNRYNQVFEYMFVLSKYKPNTFNLIKDVKKICIGNNKLNSFRQKSGKLNKKRITNFNKFALRSNVWKYSPGFMKSTKYKDAFKHPAIFPEQLAIDHIVSWSKPTDLIYDPFMGSGTTGVACVKLDRRFIGSEISEEYCGIANKRIKHEQNKIKVKQCDIFG